MVKTRMPRDDNSQSIPVLRFRPGGSQTVMTSTSANTSAAVNEGTRIVTIVSNVAAYFETGNASVTATTSSHFLPAGIPYDIALGSDLSNNANYHTHLSFILGAGTGIVYISERE